MLAEFELVLGCDRRHAGPEIVALMISYWLVFFVGQTLVTIIVAAVVYNRLRAKLHPSGLQVINQQMAELKQHAAQLSQRLDRDAQRVRIVVNTLPKVGSTSIVDTLRNAMPEAKVHHFHALSLESQRFMATSPVKPANAFIRDVGIHNLFKMMEVRPELERLRVEGLSDAGVSFISGTREPIGWALSWWFQIHDLGGLPDKALDLQHVRQAIIDWMNGNLQSRFLPEDWFQREVHGYLGVNPAELGFDVARGYQVYETKRGRLLIVRQENLTRLPDALAELLTVPPALFSMSKSNVMEGKAQGSAYRHISSALRFPAAFLEEIYARPYSTTFYSDDERKAFLAKWSE